MVHNKWSKIFPISTAIGSNLRAKNLPNKAGPHRHATRGATHSPIQPTCASDSNRYPYSPAVPVFTGSTYHIPITTTSTFSISIERHITLRTRWIRPRYVKNLLLSISSIRDSSFSDWIFYARRMNLFCVPVCVNTSFFI